MFWIKFILIAAILLVVLLLGVEFSTLNTDPVTVKYLLGETVLPLSLVVVCAFAAGVLVTGADRSFRRIAIALASGPVASGCIRQGAGNQLVGQKSRPGNALKRPALLRYRP